MDQELEALSDVLSSAHDQGVDEIASLKDAVDEFRANEDRSDEDHESLIGRLRHGVEKFEASHPDLSAAFARAVDALTAWGI